jgi:hypothetical protein
MSPSTIALITLTLVTCAGLLIGDWRRRAGRGSPLTRVRTAVRRRAGRKVSDVEGRQLLAAGFAAQVIGPLLARSTAAARRADAAKTRLERKLDGEHRERAELQNLVARLGDAYDGVRPTNPRWHRYCFYGLVMVVDIGTGLVIAKGVNLDGGEALGFGASAGMFLFFLGKLGGTGLRRLDLGPVWASKVHRDPASSSDAPALLHPDVGKPWVSTAMIVVSVVGMVVFIAGMTASRMVAQGITDAALAATQQAQGTSGVALPKVPWWQSGLSSAVALGSFAATAFLALRNHPVTRRIEELELRITRRTREATKAVRPLGSAAETSSRRLALLDAAMAEIAARLDLDADLSAVAPFGQVCKAVGELHRRQAACVAALDAASGPRLEPAPDDDGRSAEDMDGDEVAGADGRTVDLSDDATAESVVSPPAPDLVGVTPGSGASSNGVGR